MRLALCLLAAGAAGMAVQGQTQLKVGDKAPDFSLPQTMGKEPVKLSDFQGKKNVILAFFPAAFTGG